VTERPHAHHVRGVAILLTAGWFGIVTGFAEVVLLGVKKFWMGQFIRFGQTVMWLAPLADVALFLGVAVILLLMAKRWPQMLSVRIVTLTFSFLSFLSLLLMYYPLHFVAKALLAAGLAVQSARMAGRWPDRFRRLMRWSLPAAAALLLVVLAGERMQQSRREAALASVASSPAPNVLLIVWDTVRAQNLSLHGYQRQTTPSLERWATAGVVFDEAISTAPWTLPSHASMFTGRWPFEMTADLERPLDTRDLTLAEALAQRGYATAAFVANTQYCGYEFGLGRGFGRYDDYVASPRELLISSSLLRSVANDQQVRRILGYYDNIPRKSATEVTDRFLGWLERKPHRPFFAFLNYFDAHLAYLPPAPFSEKFGPDLPRGNQLLNQDLRHTWRLDWRDRSSQEIQTEMNMYDGAIAYMDAELGRLLSALRERGEFDRTVVIITSDHGEEFGEHGLYGHTNSLYSTLLHVPLVITYPAGIPAGRRIASRVSLRDVPSTITDLVGAGTSLFPGRSLARYWSSESSEHGGEGAVVSQVRRNPDAKPWYPTSLGDLQSVMDDHYHYIRHESGREELYATDNDPQETRDLSGSPEYRPVLDKLRSQIQQ
jgi:arylsulfatase A-like enzyme